MSLDILVHHKECFLLLFGLCIFIIGSSSPRHINIDLQENPFISSVPFLYKDGGVSLGFWELDDTVFPRDVS